MQPSQQSQSLRPSQPSQNPDKSSGGLFKTGHRWTVVSAPGVIVATRLLQNQQPEVLGIDIQSDATTPPGLQQLCGIIQKKFTGTFSLRLWRSYLNYEDCSEIIDYLAGTKWVLWIVSIFVFRLRKWCVLTLWRNPPVESFTSTIPCMVNWWYCYALPTDEPLHASLFLGRNCISGKNWASVSWHKYRFIVCSTI